MRIAVVEDERAASDLLRDYLLQYAGEHGISFEIEVYQDGMDILEDYHPVYDVIFLDIQLLHLNGMEAARRIRQMDEHVILIFITNMMQYAIEGYSVRALDYILKPVKYFDLALKLDRVVKLRQKSAKDEIVLKMKGAMKKVVISDIYYLEVMGHCILFHTLAGNLEVWNQPMNVMEQQLKEHSFARCNACYLVNLRYVTQINGMMVQVGNDELKISRGKRKEFLDALTVYMGRR